MFKFMAGVIDARNDDIYCVSCAETHFTSEDEFIPIWDNMDAWDFALSCAQCGALLDIPLTADGEDFVIELSRKHPELREELELLYPYLFAYRESLA